MKHYSLKFISEENFLQYVQNNDLHKYKDILIQVFTSKNDIEAISFFQNLIKKNLPQAELIGSTTDGEINSEGLHENSTIFSISCFEKTKVKTSFVETHDDSSDSVGKKIIQNFSKEDLKNTKVAFTFSDGLYTNGEQYLHGINNCEPHILLAGGMAGDKSTFTDTYVFTKDIITNRGAVMAILINPELYYYNDFSFDWEALGTKHIVTKADGNRIYTIDNIK